MMKYPRIYKSALGNKFYRQTMSGSFEAAGIVTPGDIAEIEAVTILDEVLGLARPKYTLRALCRSIRMDKLTARIDVATALAGIEKVPALVEAEIVSQAYAPVPFDLWKNVVHVVVSDEAGKKAAHDILGMHVSDAARDLARMENKQIVEIAEACTEKVATVTYDDWGHLTTGVSTYNPMTPILASMEYIEGKGYEPDFMALHPNLWGKFIQNTHVRDLIHAGVASIGVAGGQFSLPGWPTVKVYTDYALTKAPTESIGPLVGSSKAPALVLGEGPTEAEKYRDPKAGYDAYIIRQYLEPQLVLQDAIDKICV